MSAVASRRLILAVRAARRASRSPWCSPWHAMRAITYTQLGNPSVLELVERPVPEPGDAKAGLATAAGAHDVVNDY